MFNCRRFLNREQSFNIIDTKVFKSHVQVDNALVHVFPVQHRENALAYRSYGLNSAGVTELPQHFIARYQHDFIGRDRVCVPIKSVVEI